MTARHATAGSLPAGESLTAAAKDLLAALKAIVIETMDYPPAKPYSADSHLPAHLLKAAQAAISKAEGAA